MRFTLPGISMVLPARRATFLLATVTALAGSGSPVHAALRYVSPTGSDANNGSSLAWAWATIGKANANLMPGDVCVLFPGTYPQSINPARGGTAAARITYVGNLATPAAVVVQGIQLNQPWVTVKGVRALTDSRMSWPATNDSIAWCALAGMNFWAAKSCLVGHNTITGNIHFLANEGRACFLGTTPDPACMANSERDTLRANVVDLGILSPGARAFTMRAFTQQCLVDSNRISGVFDVHGSTIVDETLAFVCYNAVDDYFRDNRWVFEATSAPPPSTQWEAFRLRDSTRSMLFERDTLLLGEHSTYPVRGLFAASGSFVHSVTGNRWNQCFIKTNSYLYTQDVFSHCTIENSVIASRNQDALWFQGDFENSTLRHNTLYSGGQTMRISKIVGSSNEITSNLFYSAMAGSSSSGQGGQVFFDREALTGFVSNFNLYFTPSYSIKAGDRSILWCCFTGSPPGIGLPWNGVSGQDAQSRYGSPMFADSTFDHFDPRLRPGTLAAGAGQFSTDAGAIPTSVTVDLVRPAAIRDLRAP
jgi:hypothetical protein